MPRMTLARAIRIADRAQKAKIALRCELDALRGEIPQRQEYATAFSSIEDVVIYMRNTFSVIRAMQEEIDILEKTDAVSREILHLASCMKIEIVRNGETVNE